MEDKIRTPMSGLKPISRIIQLFRSANPRTRARFARVVGKYAGYRSFLETRLADEDHRVRANVIESLWKADTPMVLEVLRRAAVDSNHRVRTNALVGLHLAGEPGIVEVLADQVANGSPEFRRAAVWAMGETGCHEFCEILARLSTDKDESVRKLATAAIAGKLRAGRVELRK